VQGVEVQLDALVCFGAGHEASMGLTTSSISQAAQLLLTLVPGWPPMLSMVAGVPIWHSGWQIVGGLGTLGRRLTVTKPWLFLTVTLP